VVLAVASGILSAAGTVAEVDLAVAMVVSVVDLTSNHLCLAVLVALVASLLRNPPMAVDSVEASAGDLVVDSAEALWLQDHHMAVASEGAMVAQALAVKCLTAWVDQHFNKPMEADNNACLGSQCHNMAAGLVGSVDLVAEWGIKDEREVLRRSVQ